jgi:addiction module HigA family antidote
MMNVDRRRTPRMRPVHPGQILRDDVRPALGLSVTDMARRLRVSRATLHRLLACEIGVSPEMALRLGKLCGNGAGLWLRMQADFDLWQAERALRDELALIELAPHDQAA